MTVGYDMRWIDTPSGQADKSYFQISCCGMSIYADVMLGLGMLYPSTPNGPFPKPEDSGTTWDAYIAFRDDNDFTNDVLQQLVECYDAMNAYLSWAPGGVGIPSHKVCGTNDGWIVTPAECEQAVAAWVAHQTWHVDVPHAWTQWIEYLSGAAKHGGFTVR